MDKLKLQKARKGALAGGFPPSVSALAGAMPARNHTPHDF
jgi:hypothetical protein